MSSSFSVPLVLQSRDLLITSSCFNLVDGYFPQLREASILAFGSVADSLVEAQVTCKFVVCVPSFDSENRLFCSCVSWFCAEIDFIFVGEWVRCLSAGSIS